MELATEDFWGRGHLAICRAVLTHRPKDHLKKKSATLPRKSSAKRIEFTVLPCTSCWPCNTLCSTHSAAQQHPDRAC